MTEEKRSWIQPYYPAFDGLRAVAILSVFYCHYAPVGNHRLHSGISWAGVDLFFVLSGFLITGILYDSRHKHGYFRGFYIRRSLRILPVYWGFLLAVIALAPFLHLLYGPIFFVNFAFLQNFLFRGLWVHHAGSAMVNPSIVSFARGAGRYNIELGHLWSLCVEEQFYLIWPLVVWLVPQRKKLMWLACGMGATAVAVRCLLFATDRVAAEGSSYLYSSSFSRCDELLIGAWLALWLRERRLSVGELNRLSAGLLVTATLVLLVLLALAAPEVEFDERSPVMQTVGFTLIGLAAAGVLLRSLHAESRLHRWLKTGWLQHLGRISYGFYVYHGLPQSYFTWLKVERLGDGARGLLIIPIAFAFTYSLALTSFRLLEGPFLKLKTVLAPAFRPSVPEGGERG